MTQIYVICEHNGYEGHGAPIQAANTLEDAEALIKLMRLGGYGASMKMYAVPLWPDSDGNRYREEIKP